MKIMVVNIVCKCKKASFITTLVFGVLHETEVLAAEVHQNMAPRRGDET